MPSPLIEIPPDDIFKNDRLGLEPAIQGRTHALLARSPQAVAIDGRWGTGKSTFLALWEAYLRREGVKVVQFNAWKSFGADPFDALIREILRQVEVPASKQKRPHRQLAALLKRHAGLAATGVRLASIFHPDYAEVSQATAVGIESAANAIEPEPNNVSDPKVESPDEFASLLTAAAMTWSDRPVVVMVDELDRCSPEYAVEFLQLLEHVFHAENVVFVVAINRIELQHSLKAFYGQGFNAEGYLERFFDDIFTLPVSNRSEYINSSLTPVVLRNMSTTLSFFHSSDLSLREIDKSVEVFTPVIANNASLAYTLTHLWTARTLAPSAYRAFISGGISDKELVDAVFSNGNCANLRIGRPIRELRGLQTLEVELILFYGTFLKLSLWDYFEDLSIGSELFRYYRDIIGKDTAGNVTDEYANGILSMAASRASNLDAEEHVQEIAKCVRVLERELPPA